MVLYLQRFLDFFLTKKEFDRLDGGLQTELLATMRKILQFLNITTTKVNVHIEPAVVDLSKSLNSLMFRKPMMRMIITLER